MKKTVVKTVPRREIMKASDKRARFLLTTTNQQDKEQWLELKG